MSTSVLAEWLTSLSLPERARLLVRISSELTIYAREYGLSGPDSGSNHKRLIGTNELQHKLMGQAGLYLDGVHDNVYPPDVFSEILSQTAEHYGIASDLATAVRHARGGGALLDL